MTWTKLRCSAFVSVKVETVLGGPLGIEWLFLPLWLIIVNTIMVNTNGTYHGDDCFTVPFLSKTIVVIIKNAQFKNEPFNSRLSENCFVAVQKELLYSSSLTSKCGELNH